jgi:hypothetical protein
MYFLHPAQIVCVRAHARVHACVWVWFLLCQVLIVKHMVTVAAASKNVVNHKLLSFQVKLGIISMVGA